MARAEIEGTGLSAKRRRIRWRRRRIIYNNDGNGIFADGAHTPERFLAQRMHAVLGTQVDSVFYCTGTATMFSHQTNVGEVYGKYIREGTYAAHGKRNIQALAELGTDTLATVVEFCHENDLEVFFTHRINDIHDCFGDWELATWKQEHPEYLMGKAGDWERYPEDDPRRRWAALDFEIRAVRDHLLAIIDDVLARYDVDGIEVDYLRNPLFFRPNRSYRPATLEQVRILTSFQRHIHDLASKHGRRRGRPILIATRVPVTRRMGLYVGIDVEQWLKEDLLDVLTTAVGCMPFTNPTRELVELGHAHQVPVYPTIAGSGRSEHQSIDHWRGAASNFWHAGADGMVFFNHFPDTASPQFKELGDLEKLASMSKVFALDNESVSDGGINHAIITPPLPVTLCRSEPQCQLTLPIGDAVAEAAKHGRLKTATLHARFDTLEGPAVAAAIAVEVRLNDHLIMPSEGDSGLGWVTYTGDAMLYRHGDNTLAFSLRRTATPIVLKSVELRVDYCAGMTDQINVALASEGAKATVDSEFCGAPYQRSGGRIEHLNDGIFIRPGETIAPAWVASISDPHPHWAWIQFRQPARISRVVVHRADVVAHPVDFSGEFSSDRGLTFKTLFEVTQNVMSDQETVVERSFKPVVTDNFRLRITRSSNQEHPQETELSEIEVFGTFVDQKSPAESAVQPDALPQPVLEPTEQKWPFFRVRQSNERIEFSSQWLRLAVSRSRPQITSLSWDSLGKGDLQTNLLKPGEAGGARLVATPLFLPEASLTPLSIAECDGNVVRYELRTPDGGRARWEIRVGEKSIQMVLTSLNAVESVFALPPALKFAFDIVPTPTAPITNPRPGLAAPLPCLLHASDLGSMLVVRTDGGASALNGQRTRSERRWDACIVDQTHHRTSDGLFVLPPGIYRWELSFSVETITPVAALTSGDSRLETLPRHWLNTFQYRDDIGALSNNIISANATTSCMLHFIEPAVFTPPLPGGVEAIQVGRETLDRYFQGARGYGQEGDHPLIFTDSYPCFLITAWEVIRVTGDMTLLQRWLPALEGYAAFMQQQDRNDNGFPESIKPGTPGQHRSPSANIADQINFGHEDAYSAALTYRALRCLADLQRLAGCQMKAGCYEDDAEKIRAGYMDNFFNPETGVIAGWRDCNGILHDYWFPWVNGAAIVYGLVPVDQANAVVDRIEKKLCDIGYDRFDLGLPIALVPIRKHDYGNLQLDGRPAMGTAVKEDGSDGFGEFANGGTGALLAYWYIQALYQLDRREEADRIFWPMMSRYAAGRYQNREKPTSASGGFGTGLEFMHWNGTPSGYEGFLADSYCAQMALFTGYYGIGFGPEGFRLEPWSPLKGRRVKLGLKYMGEIVEEID